MRSMQDDALVLSTPPENLGVLHLPAEKERESAGRLLTERAVSSEIRVSLGPGGVAG